MGIKIVVNGYFRSGTTFVWDFLKSSLRDYTCFYEPLQLEIATHIQKEKNDKTKSRLLNQFLWQEYIHLDEQTFLQLLRNHPNITKDGINGDRAIIEYFNIIHNNQKGNVLLQPNRLHFFLDLFKKEYDAKLVHVIRHPLDVYLSIINVDKTVYLNRGKTEKIKYYFGRLLRTIYPSIRTRLGDFEVDKDYIWIRRHLGLPYSQEYTWLGKFVLKKSFFEQFIIVWTVSNYYAIKTINAENGYLLVYEELITNTGKVKKDLETYLDLEIKKFPDVKKGNCFKFKKTELKKLERIIRKNKLEEQFNYVLDEVKKRKINYL